MSKRRRHLHCGTGSHLRQQRVSGEGVNGGNCRYVHSENTIPFATHIQAKLILARSVSVGLRRQGWRVGRKVAIEVLQLFLNLFVARCHQALIVTKSFQRLSRRYTFRSSKEAG